jgi:hypothetical protein
VEKTEPEQCNRIEDRTGTQEEFLCPVSGRERTQELCFYVSVVGFAGKRRRPGSPAEAKRGCSRLLLILLLLPLLMLLLLRLLMLLLIALGLWLLVAVCCCGCC